MNPMFLEYHFFAIFVETGFELSPVRGCDSSVCDHVITRQKYTVVELVNG